MRDFSRNRPNERTKFLMGNIKPGQKTGFSPGFRKEKPGNTGLMPHKPQRWSQEFLIARSGDELKALDLLEQPGARESPIVFYGGK
jgi:hypothetical protein